MWLTQALVLAAAGGVGAYLVSTSPRPSAEWQASSAVVDSASTVQWVRRAEAALGVAVARAGGGGENELIAVERGILEDTHPLGLPRKCDGWRVAVARVPVHQAKSSLWVPVTISVVFDATTGRLVCAYAGLAGPWIVNEHTDPNDVEARAQELQWIIEDPGNATFRSTIPEVLGGVWAVFGGLDPRHAKYVIVRPRAVRLHFPVDIKGGVPTPKDPFLHLRWIVEARGSVINTRSGFHYTVALVAVDDGAPTKVQGTTLP
jgi:hypothetical protein